MEYNVKEKFLNYHWNYRGPSIILVITTGIYLLFIIVNLFRGPQHESRLVSA